MSVSIKQLNENDWLEFSQIRLKALKTDPEVFGSNYESESKFTKSDWRSRLQSKDSAVFMIFAGDTLIGMTGVSLWQEDKTNRTAIFWGSWLEPDFRRKSLSEVMYRARLDWVKQRPTIERIIVSHRASNVASKYANQKHGFVFTRTHKKAWADSKIENEVCYELKISEK